MKLKTSIVIILVFVILMVSCQYNKSEALPDCATVPARFATDVLPLIHAKCATICHNALTINAGGPLTDYNQIKTKAAQIKFQVQSRNMPMVGSLTDAQIKIISCWVDAGAENN